MRRFCIHQLLNSDRSQCLLNGILSLCLEELLLLRENSASLCPESLLLRNFLRIVGDIIYLPTFFARVRSKSHFGIYFNKFFNHAA